MPKIKIDNSLAVGLLIDLPGCVETPSWSSTWPSRFTGYQRVLSLLVKDPHGEVLSLSTEGELWVRDGVDPLSALRQAMLMFAETLMLNFKSEGAVKDA